MFMCLCGHAIFTLFKEEKEIMYYLVDLNTHIWSAGVILKIKSKNLCQLISNLYFCVVI